MHKFIRGLSLGMAILGGAVLFALILLVCASVLGRGLNGLMHGGLGTLMPGFAQWALDAGVGPINGDFELVESGVAFAIFAFLPLCQLTAGHASVDIFTSKLPARVNRILQMLIDLVFAAVLILIAAQLNEGLQSKLRYGETTFLLQFPIWWAYAASLLGAVAAAVVAIYVALVRIAEVITARAILPTEDAPQ